MRLLLLSGSFCCAAHVLQHVAFIIVYDTAVILRFANDRAVLLPSLALPGLRRCLRMTHHTEPVLHTVLTLSVVLSNMCMVVQFLQKAGQVHETERRCTVHVMRAVHSSTGRHHVCTCN